MQTVSLNNRNNSIAFKGIKQEKILAENILKTYQEVVPYTKSNTRVKAHINRYSENQKFLNIIKGLVNLEKRLSEQVTKSREPLRKKRMFNSFDELTNMLLERIKATGVGNCGERNYLLQNLFLKKKVNAHAVRLVSYNKQTLQKTHGKDHTFVVFNLKPDAILEEPSSWGNKAIIADAYANIIMNAKDALEFYKGYFAINPQKEVQLFFNADKIKLPDGIR